MAACMHPNEVNWQICNAHYKDGAPVLLHKGVDIRRKLRAGGLLVRSISVPLEAFPSFQCFAFESCILIFLTVLDPSSFSGLRSTGYLV